MRFKPIPDSVRCAALEARYLAMVRNGTEWRCIATDSDYVLENIIRPTGEDADEFVVYITTTDEPH